MYILSILIFVAQAEYVLMSACFMLRNGPGFDPSIRRHSGIWGAADEAVLNIVRKKRKNPPKKYY